MLAVELIIAGEPIRARFHDYPHWEEVVAAVMAEECGTPEFLAEHCFSGTLLLGVAGGELDEHPDQQTGEGQKKGCCATLMADALGIDVRTDRVWRRLILFSHYADTGKAFFGKQDGAERKHVYDPHCLLVARFRRLRRMVEDAGRTVTNSEQEQVLRQAMDDARVLLWDQKMFQCAYEQVKSEARRETIDGPNGKKLNLVVITSDNHQVNNVARNCFGADVVVQRNSTGHTHIFTANGAKLCLDDVAQVLNITELELAGVVMEDDWEELRKEGFAYEDGRWYYARGAGQLHNGTEGHCEIEPTLLDLDEIVKLVKLALDTQYFAGWNCQPSSCQGGGCDLYNFGFQRCRKTRYEKYKQREAANA